jgi:predicted acyl esterase
MGKVGTPICGGLWCQNLHESWRWAQSPACKRNRSTAVFAMDHPTLFRDFDVISPIELRLDAACTAPDTAFIAVLQDVDENENAINVTADYLRAGLRAVDQAASRRGTPFLPCRTFKAVPVGEKVSYC